MLLLLEAIKSMELISSKAIVFAEKPLTPVTTRGMGLGLRLQQAGLIFHNDQSILI
jgi:hypothetical protein